MGILQSLFGGSSSKSKNKSYDFIKSQYGPATGYTAQAGNAVSQFLGGDSSGFDAYKGATGFDFGMGEGLKNITGNAAAKGLLRSGPTQRALVRYGNDYSQQYARDYINQYLGLGQLGLGAGGLIANAGQESSGSSSSGGLGRAIGTALAIFSDPRLKTDIERIGTEPDGLGVYRYRYLWEDEPREGVMADEVAALRPWALGPQVGGFATVRMDLL